jgi:hypothetical protein
VRFFGVPARREEAAYSWSATTKQRSWSVKETCNLVRSASHQLGESFELEKLQRFKNSINLRRGQLPFLGLALLPQLEAALRANKERHFVVINAAA